MRTLSATLLAAQKKAQRLPYVEVKAYDFEQGIKRLTWTKVYDGTEPDNYHGIAFDGQGSMHRVRAAAGDKLYYQKVAAPDESSDYSQWTEIAADCAGPCAVAAEGARVYIFYRTTGNVLWKYYSGDYGQSWSDAQLVTYANALCLAAAWWGTSDIVVCFALTADELNAITLDTGSQVAAQHTWSDGNHPLVTTYGIGATFDATLDQCEVVFAAKESDSPYDHYDLFRTRLSNTYNFLALESFLAYPEGEDFTLEYPDCHLPANPQSYEATRVLAVEKFAGTTAYTRPLTCHMVKGTSWSDTTFTEPKPFLDDSPAYGLRMSSTSTHWWTSRPGGLWRAPRPADSPLDLSGDIVSLQQNVIASPDSSGRGNLILTLDNSRAQYTPIPSGLRFRAEIVLHLGYKTTAGDETSEAGTFWLDSWEYQSVSLRGESRSNLSTLTLSCIDGRGLMDRWSARYQMRWNKDAVNPRSVWQILYQLLARAGIRLTNTPAEPQSSLINNFCPDFTVSPGTSGATAVDKLLTFVPDRLVFRGQEAFTKDPVAAEASGYTYSTDPTDPTNSHVILSGVYREESHASHARAIGRAEPGNRIVADNFDWDLLQLGIDILEQTYDPNLNSAVTARERTEALLRQVSLRTERGNLVVPANVGQELLDVVTVTDARCGIFARPYRVQAIRTDYDRRKVVYEQELSLGAP
jgi:hypothetical protein